MSVLITLYVFHKIYRVEDAISRYSIIIIYGVCDGSFCSNNSLRKFNFSIVHNFSILVHPSVNYYNKSHHNLYYEIIQMIL